MPFSLYVAFGRFLFNLEPLWKGEVPEQHMTLTLNLPWNQEVHVRLGTFVEWRGSGTTFDIRLVPPTETGGSCPTLNLHGVKRFLTNIYSFVESKSS